MKTILNAVFEAPTLDKQSGLQKIEIMDDEVVIKDITFSTNKNFDFRLKLNGDDLFGLEFANVNCLINSYGNCYRLRYPLHLKKEDKLEAYVYPRETIERIEVCFHAGDLKLIQPEQEAA